MRDTIKFLLIAVIVLMLISPLYAETDVRVNYLIAIDEGRYKDAYSMFTDRLKEKFVSKDNYIERHLKIEEFYKANDIKETLNRKSITIIGNVVTYELIAVHKNGTFQKAFMQFYIVVIDNKIDIVVMEYEPVVIEEGTVS